MIRKWYSHQVSLILTALSLGCGVPQPPKTIAISKAPVFRPAKPADIKNFEQALAAIITVCRDDLKLPVVEPLELRLYKNSMSFAQYGFGWTTLPIDVANTTATAVDNKIHIDLEKTKGASWVDLVWILAHEYAHNINYRIAGENLRGSPWFIEGFGDWVAAKVLHSLGWQDYAIALHRVNQELIRHHELLPKHSPERGGWSWHYLRGRPKGRVRTYSLAFALVDRFIEKEGLSAMLDYLHWGDSTTSFALSSAAFFSEFEKDLSAMKPRMRTGFSMQRPTWKVGHQWAYMERRPGVTRIVAKEIVREDHYRGISSFVIRVGTEEHFYTKATLAFMAAMKDGRVIVRNNKPDRVFSWPLEAGSEWRNSFIRQNLEEGSTRELDDLMVVANDEEIRIPAGAFKATKIQAYASKSGRLMAEYWYSPNARWFVKVRNYRPQEGFIEEELVSLKTD